jgi:hypothetical protein
LPFFFRPGSAASVPCAITVVQATTRPMQTAAADFNHRDMIFDLLEILELNLQVFLPGKPRCLYTFGLSPVSNGWSGVNITALRESSVVSVGRAAKMDQSGA